MGKSAGEVVGPEGGKKGGYSIYICTYTYCNMRLPNKLVGGGSPMVKLLVLTSDC